MAATRESHALSSASRSASRSHATPSRATPASAGGTTRPRRASPRESTLAGTSLAASIGPRPWRWWMRQPVHARRAFRGLVQVCLALLGYGALLARPQAGALGTLGGWLYAFAGWGAYPLLALLLAWGVALVGVGLTQRAPLSRLQLASAVVETLALLVAVRVFVGQGAGGWLAGILARPLTDLPPLVAHGLVSILALVLLLPLARVGPRTAYRAAAGLRTRTRASHGAPNSPTAAPTTGAPSAALLTEHPAARDPHDSQPARPLSYVESAAPTRQPSAPPRRLLLAAPSSRPSTATSTDASTDPATDPTATPTRIIDATPTPPSGFLAGQGWPTAGRADVPWRLPPLDLFDVPTVVAHIDQHALLALAARLDAALRRAGVDARVPREDVLIGPALLTFVLTPPPHLRRERAGEWLDHVLQRRDALLTALDIPEAHMTLPTTNAAPAHEASPSMHASVPPAARVWVQLPHATARSVSLHEVVTARSVASVASPLLLPLGRTTTGEARGVDLARCAHLVIGGGARTGKSSLVQTLLAGMLSRATPRDLVLALADPTRRALGEFEGLPHLLAPVATTSAAILALLDTALDEARRREHLLATRGVASFAAYRVLCRDLSEQTPLPHIVLALDATDAWDAPTQRALASRLMRLAGIGHLTGISLILAGQTPAAAPLFQALEGMLAARVAFATDTAADARGILGIGGAEGLTRAGDLLFLPIATGTVERVHAAHVSVEEVHRLTRFWKRQAALAASEDATTIPGLYHAPEDATVLLTDARARRSSPSSPAYERYEQDDTPLGLPPLPGRQPGGPLSRREGDSSAKPLTNAAAGVPLAMFAQMMRALVARGEEDTDETDTFGGRRHWGARERGERGTDEED